MLKPSFVGHLFVPPKYHFKECGNTTAVKEQRIHNREDFRRVLELIFHPLNTVLNS